MLKNVLKKHRYTISNKRNKFTIANKFVIRPSYEMSLI